MCPVTEADGHDGPGSVNKLAPGLAAVIENVRVGREDPVREPVLPEILPNVLDRVVMVTLCCWFVLRCRSISPAKCAVFLPAPIAL